MWGKVWECCYQFRFSTGFSSEHFGPLFITALFPFLGSIFLLSRRVSFHLTLSFHTTKLHWNKIMPISNLILIREEGIFSIHIFVQKADFSFFTVVGREAVNKGPTYSSVLKERPGSLIWNFSGRLYWAILGRLCWGPNERHGSLFTLNKKGRGFMHWLHVRPNSEFPENRRFFAVFWRVFTQNSPPKSEKKRISFLSIFLKTVPNIWQIFWGNPKICRKFAERDKKGEKNPKACQISILLLNFGEKNLPIKKSLPKKCRFFGKSEFGLTYSFTYKTRQKGLQTNCFPMLSML